MKDSARMSGGNYGSVGRYLLFATIFICIAIAGVGVGLGVYIHSVSEKLSPDCSGSSLTGQTATTTVPQTSTVPTSSNVFVSSSKEGFYRYGAVASDAGICSTVGTDIMARQSGSAVDAAIAALLCQCVQNLHSCGIGGGHFMTVYNRENNTAYTIIAREMAPSAANENMYVGNQSSTEGGMTVGIPGEIKGMYTAWKLGGKLPWKTLFQPTIRLLRDGMPVNSALALAIQRNGRFYPRQENLRQLLTNPTTGFFFKEGEIMKLPTLAATFTTIADEGPDAFYNGSLSQNIVKDIQDAGGIITEKDLLDFTAVVKEPLVIRLTDNSSVYSPPPPSSGAVYEMILNIVDEFGMSNDSISTPQKEILAWHRIIEAFKFSYAKRSSLGDGDGEDDAFRTELNVLLKNMTSKSFAAYVRSQIDDDRTHNTMYYGPTFYDVTKTSTAHLSVLAPNGDAVSVTSTINLHFGSKVVGSRTGIIFNNEMDDFSTPNTTNSFGVPASEANFIKPLKRPLSSMCPSIITDSNGVVRLVVGASGGTKITTSTAMVTIETLMFGLDIKQAIDHRRIHHQLLPKELAVEKGFPEDILDGLRSIGHNITLTDTAGSVVQGILQRHEGDITANCDFRKSGYPDGY
ncbi:gamma-glutamyltranspeptidase 1-like [Mizuhopecten yessoensis]|uniref:gamma-glutamyltranspeptidase 1-like n=1 Tax=Mizuhopecten yessoensis TaxID=6573 RepID=UPI000B45C1AC|nr:gamma-glutamyltranspeptidase 1-like [Mizuhopecten yessoensis]XP_021342931.1 gamma-glutamyltranspeptidase 1-like [Mizuhopecten yessoensis]